MDQIVDYGTLKTAVKAYLHRTDLDESIPVFIALGISKINRECMSVHQEQTAILTVPAGTTLVALPENYKAMRNVTCDGQPLGQVSLNQKDLDYSNTSGTPISYIVADNRLTIHPAPDGDVELKMIFFDKVQTLSADTDTHNLLLANPNIFIYSTMREAAPFIENDERTGLWAELLKEEIISENNMSQEARWSGSPLSIQSTETTP